jgi:rhodanese-related sulfurtransferase
VKTVTLSQLAEGLRATRRPILVEALPPRYFVQGHLPGALNIDVGDVAAKASSLLPAKDATIIVYCASASCSNSEQVASQLHALGYRDVAVYKGGKAEWTQAGNALETAP